MAARTPYAVREFFAAAADGELLQNLPRAVPADRTGHRAPLGGEFCCRAGQRIGGRYVDRPLFRLVSGGGGERTEARRPAGGPRPQRAWGHFLGGGLGDEVPSGRQRSARSVDRRRARV